MQKKTGRPSTYKQEYDDLLIKHMTQGFSFESFGGLPEIRTHKDVLYNWTNIHPTFADAKKIGEAACLRFWEGIGIARSLGKIKDGCAASYIFNMKNRFKWTDRVDIATKTDLPKTINLKYSLEKNSNSSKKKEK